MPPQGGGPPPPPPAPTQGPPPPPPAPPSEGGSSSGGTSSSSGSASSTGGSSRTSGPSPEAIANAVNSYRNQFAAWGIKWTPQLTSLVTSLVRAGQGSSTILLRLRQTKAYARRFPGIFRKDGTMRMSESQYIAGYQSARDFAASVGRNFSAQAYGMAIKNGNSPSELRAKIEALDILKTNRSYFEEFNDYLLAKGIIQKPLQRSDALKFIMGEGPREWEQEWDAAAQAAQLAKLGVDVGKPKEGADISYKAFERLQRQLAPGTEPDFGALAEALTAIPPSNLYGYGLTKKMVTTLAYGGKGAKEIAEVATRALAQYRATVGEPFAHPQLAQSQSGTQVLTGRRPVQATE